MKKYIKIIIATSVTFIIASYLVLFITDSTMSSDKFALMELLKVLSEHDNAIDDCWNINKTAPNNCNKLDHIFPIVEENRYYFSTSDKSLIGVDFKEKVVVMLTPTVIEDSLVWKCTGMPSDALPMACQAIR